NVANLSAKDPDTGQDINDTINTSNQNKNKVDYGHFLGEKTGEIKGKSGKVARVGDTILFDIIINPKEFDIKNIVVQDTMPKGLTYESAKATDGSISYSNGVMTFKDDKVAKGDKVVITITAKANGSVLNEDLVNIAYLDTDVVKKSVALSASNTDEYLIYEKDVHQVLYSDFIVQVIPKLPVTGSNDAYIATIGTIAGICGIIGIAAVYRRNEEC
ncbi:MAG: DUF11 domain-containing protein, partial [Bacilli bacterium]|nr:DUF11 domain-containing protein [Bacilli bacterium]